jgi:hypothetical protein
MTFPFLRWNRRVFVGTALKHVPQPGPPDKFLHTTPNVRDLDPWGPEPIACDMARMGCGQWHAIDVSDGRVSSIDELLDRAVAAINCGDRPSALAAR